MPTVSAMIPCFNGAKWLRETIASIQNQTHPVSELIVVDDCSTDDSGDIARSCGAKVVRNAVNSGEGYSRNHGIRTASGTYVASLDADDLWKPHHIATLMRLVEDHPQTTAAFGAVQRFGLRDETIYGYVPPGAPTNVFWLAFNDWVHIPSASMISREALLRVGGFNESERYSVDFDMWLRLSQDHLFAATHEVTSLWRWHSESQSSSRARQIKAVYRFRQRYIDDRLSRGDDAFSREVRHRLPSIWRRDIADAWRSRDVGLIKFLVDYAHRHVEGVNAAERIKWDIRSHIPKTTLTMFDRLRRSEPVKVG